MRYEVIHDTIARQIFEKASTEARTRRKIEKFIRERYGFHRERGVLLTKDDLDYIHPYLDAVSISEEEVAFIRRSEAVLDEQAREEEARQQRELKQAQARGARRLRTGLLTAVVFVVAALAAFFALCQKQRAEEQGRLANSGRLASQALLQLDRELDLALLLSLEAYLTVSTAEARSALLTSLQHNPRLHLFLHHQEGVQGVAFSPDGKHLASGSSDAFVRVWDATSGALLTELAGHEGRVTSVTFSPDGTRLVTGSTDSTIIVWDVGTRRPVSPPQYAHRGVVWDVAFSPDGTHLASGSNDGTVRLWDVATGRPLGRPLLTLPAQTTVSSVAFSADGKHLASGSADGLVRLWGSIWRRGVLRPVASPIVT